MRRWFTCLLLLIALAAHAVEPAVSAPPLDVLAQGFGGWPALRAVRTFAYRLTVTDKSGAVTRDALYRLELANGHVWSKNLLADEETWWDGASGWRRTGSAPAERDEQVARKLREHAAYNFFRLLRDPATRAEWSGLRRICLTPAGQAAFEVELFATGHRIALNDFGDVTVAEASYEPIESLVWPRCFSVGSKDGVVATGRYRELVLLDAPALLPATGEK